MAVTHMDEAITGRLFHVHLRFDMTGWLAWARTQKFDLQGLSFFNRYPELLHEEMSAREAAQFLQVIGCIPKAAIDQILLVARSMLPLSYADRFLSWIRLDEPAWLTPQTFLTIEDPEIQLNLLHVKVSTDDARRIKLELLQDLTHIANKSQILTKTAVRNLVTLLADAQIDGNMTLAFLHHFDRHLPCIKLQWSMRRYGQKLCECAALSVLEITWCNNPVYFIAEIVPQHNLIGPSGKRLQISEGVIIGSSNTESVTQVSACPNIAGVN